MPMKRELYPKNWKQIAFQVKEESGWKCEICGQQCRRPVEPFDTHRRTLTVMHLDQNPQNCDRSNLKAGCSKCHLAYDQQQHVDNRKRTMDERKRAAECAKLAEVV